MSLLRRSVCFAMVAGCLVFYGCGSKPPAVKGPILPGPYVILENDDLSEIALRAYGEMELWYTLLNANPQLTRRPNFALEIDETITIPPREKLDLSLPKSVFPKQLPADYIVMPGDSLHFISQGCYGDRELWPLIYEANRSILSERVKEDTRQLIAGQVLRIPSRERGAGSRENER